MKVESLTRHIRALFGWHAAGSTFMTSNETVSLVWLLKVLEKPCLPLQGVVSNVANQPSLH